MADHMPDIWAVVPVKAFQEAKQRLARAYSADFRCQLARAMLHDVLDTLSRARGLAGILVVTLDPEVKRLASGYGAEILDEAPEGGLNEAVSSAALQLVRQHRDGMLVVPGDLPCITVLEVERLLQFHGCDHVITVVPAHDRKGTNALLMTPPDAMPPSFGENSFERHLRNARSAGLAQAELMLSGFGLDLDNPQDVEAFIRTRPAVKTWGYIQSQGLIHCKS